MSFAEDLQDGKKAEELVRFKLSQTGKFEAIWDCSDDKYFQSKDIDILALKPDGGIAKIEVKADRQAHRTGNLAWEQKTSGNIGCFAKTEADYIMYYVVGNGELYIFQPKELRRYIEQSHKRMFPMGDNAEGYLLNIKALFKEGTIRRIL
jgi:hypothetical protein